MKNRKSSPEKMQPCGGRCKGELSAVVTLYDARKMQPYDGMGTVWFKRACYCTNKGCGWRQQWPEVPVSGRMAAEVVSNGIGKYLRDKSRRFPMVRVSEVWRAWIAGSGASSFDEYIRQYEAGRRGLATQPDLFDQRFSGGGSKPADYIDATPDNIKEGTKV